MAIVYRSVKGSALTSDEVDNNFQELYDGLFLLVSDAAYSGSWDGDTDSAPSKNAVYDLSLTLLPLDGSRAMTNNITSASNKGIIWTDGGYFKNLSGNLTVHSNSGLVLESDNGDNIDLNSADEINFNAVSVNFFSPAFTNDDFNFTVANKGLVWDSGNSIKDNGVTLDVTGQLNTGDGILSSDLIQFSGTDHAGLKLNNLTTTQRNALTASEGMLIANTTDKALNYYSGSWLSLRNDQTNKILEYGYNNTISNPSSSPTVRYKLVTGINVTDASDRGVIYATNSTIYTGLGSQVMVGDNNAVGQWMDSMVMVGMDMTANNPLLSSGAGQGVGVGNLVVLNDWKNTAVGWSARCDSTADSAIGWAAWCKGTGGNHRIAIGRAALAYSGGSGVLGSSTNNDWWFGNGEVHRFTNLNGTVEAVTPSGRTIVLHVGADALDVHNTPASFNVDGGPGALAPGVPTGSGAAAKLHFYQADGVNLGNNTKQALQSVGYVDTTGDLVWWDLMRINKISSTASCIVASTVSSGNIATDYSLKISNEATSINSKSGTTLDLKIANSSRLAITANTSTFGNSLHLFTGTTALAPLQFTAGTNLTTPVDGSVEYNGTNYFGTVGSTRNTFAFTSNKLSAFAATTSAELAGVISDETGSGALVFATSPTLVTPVLGVASATSITTAKIIGAAGTPGIAAGAGAGTSPTVSIVGNDVAGVITITTGSSPTATAIIATITFNSAYAVAPVVTISAANRNARDNGATKNPLCPAAGETNGVTTTTFVLESAGTNLTASTTYMYSYRVTQ